MKTPQEESVTFFKGAGYLIGSAITMLTAIGVFSISENVVVSISSSIPIGITIGIVLEQKFQREQKAASPKVKTLMLGVLLLGITAFVSMLLLVK